MKQTYKTICMLLCIPFLIVTLCQCKNDDNNKQIKVQLKILNYDEVVTVTMRIPESNDWDFKDNTLFIYNKSDIEKRHLCYMQVEIPEDILNPFARYEGGVFLSQAESVSRFYINKHHVMRGILHDTFLGADTYNYMYWFADDRYLFVVNTHGEDADDFVNVKITEDIISSLEVM